MKRLISCIVALAFTMILSTGLTFADVKEDQPKSGSPLACNAGPVAIADLLNINAATEEQIKSLPGIDEAYCKNIIAGRPYSRLDQLVSDEIVPKDIFDKIKDHIIIIPPKN
jgi:DNA uptake protein ComE-like DNA-binding protein